MKKLFFLTTLFLFFIEVLINGQDLDQILGTLSEDKSPDYVFGTFKGTTIINGQSIEVPGQGDLNFIISHRFGAVNKGIYTFFGLDQGTTRLGFEYGLKNFASLSIGRNTMDKIYDGGIKLKVLRQQTGLREIPVSISIFSSIIVKTIKWAVPDRENLLSSRFSYSTQILIARKFNQKFSMQISPSYVHKNLVPGPTDQNNIYALGLGGRYKLTHKFSLNGEYFYLFPGETARDYANSLSFGFDIEAAGHIFQLHLTNSQSMFSRGYITETTGEWTEGDIFIGFNIYRVFSTNKKGKSTK